MVARGNEYEEILEIKKGKFLTLSRVFLFPNNVQDVRHGEWSTVSAWGNKEDFASRMRASFTAKSNCSLGIA